MIGLVVVTHGQLAKELIIVSEHIVGPQDNVLAVAIMPDDDAERARERIIKAVNHVDKGYGVVVLTDMFGGTPSNLAISVMGSKPIEVIAGVNLPMMIKLLSIREEVPLEQAVLEAQEAARKYINVASALLKRQS